MSGPKSAKIGAMETIHATTILTPDERLARRQLMLRDALSLLALFLVTSVIFVLTLLLFRSFTKHRQELGARWRTRGEAALSGGHPDLAIDDLRSAMAYVSDRATEIELATALGDAGEIQEATAYFNTLRESAPGDGTINLQLARLAAKEGNENRAILYYQLALDGTWHGNGYDRRREVRLEMARYLISHHEYNSAHNQLLTADGYAPDNPDIKIEIAGLLEQAAAPQDALSIYQSIASRRKPPFAALEGAGRTAFALGMYRLATSYLSRVVANPLADTLSDDKKTTDRDMLNTSLLAAISSVVVVRGFMGAEPMFRIPSIELKAPRELMAYAVLGVIGGLLAPVFAFTLGYLRPRLRALPRWSIILQPAVAGLMVGAIGFFGFPQVMGTGYDVIDQAMHGQFIWQVLLTLVFLKLLATTLSFSSGTPGGMFAPTLFIGAMLGGAVGAFEKYFFPHLTGTVGTYSLVGMGVLFAGFLRAPLTSVFMVLEVSGNYSIILPIILANTIAFLISRSLQPVGIFEIFTQQDGLDLPSMEEQREESILRIEDALQPVTVPVVDASDTLQCVSQAVSEAHASGCLVRLLDGSWYALSDELTSASATFTSDAPIQRALKKDRTPLLFPDMPLDATLHYFPRWPLLRILNRARGGTLEGLLTIDDVLRRYRSAE